MSNIMKIKDEKERQREQRGCASYSEIARAK